MIGTNTERSKRLIVLCAALPLLLVGEASAEVGPKEAAAQQTDDAYKFELRAFGAKVGEGILSVGPEKTVGGQKLRAVRLDAKTEGMGAKLYKAVAAATSWVDHHFLPVRARWDAELPGGKRLVKAKWHKRTLEGEYFKNDKMQRKIKHRYRNHPTDVVSVFAWMAQQKLEPGHWVGRPLYDGKRFFWLHAEVGQPEEIHVPVGVRKAYPVRIKITKGKYEKKLVYWVGEDHTPLKLSFSYGVLGSVDAVLVAKKKGTTVAAR